MRNVVQNEIVNEVIDVDVLRVALKGIVPGNSLGSFVKNALHGVEPGGNRIALLRVDILSGGIVIVNIGIVLAWNIIAPTRAIRKITFSTKPTIGAGGVEVLGKTAVQCNGIHPINSQ